MNPLFVVGSAFLVTWGLVDLLLMTRGRALGIEVAPGLARALRAIAVASIVANWAYLIAAGR